MFAIRQYEFGPAETLRFEEVPDPQPAENQVLIHVASAGVHLVDTSIRKGAFGNPELPMTPGREVAGVVTQGPAEWLGRRVVAHLGMANGGYAEKAVANVEALHALPDDVSFDNAVAMIGTGRTTVGILQVAKLTPEDRVLVLSAAGGIGALLVQEAWNVGASVVGLASKGKLEHDYSELDSLEDFTVVFDGVGGEIGDQALRALGPGGRIIIYGWASGTSTKVSTEILYRNSLTATVALGPGLLKKGLRPLETEALQALQTGRFTPSINQPFALRDAAKAHEALESRATTGKVVLHP
ncbi:oxidoreductase [Lentzea sp. NBRC 105346]|uniref:zinc-binding dehydrogenase n=1 Tax=Lentzea sp. NBRC 105346 TaxID=3032205 RepID=UPI0024A197F6|nr:zinc-binding dehydrogenase [Lentzea sp. NBRC 105346]GLZ34658.1 oxidoreductase [Lentzea sp. NBRC 105346]